MNELGRKTPTALPGVETWRGKHIYSRRAVQSDSEIDWRNFAAALTAPVRVTVKPSSGFSANKHAWPAAEISSFSTYYNINGGRWPAAKGLRARRSCTTYTA